METNFNFNSQVCTDKNQSERLLALGLNKETADIRGVEGIEHTPIYAWSLGRLIEMIKKSDYLHYDDMGCIKLYLEQDDFDRVIAIISIMVKEGYFNKEYLV